MARIFLLLLLIVPALEMAILILSGNYLGVWVTIALVILTGVLGAWLARKEGLQTLNLVQIQLQRGEVPTGVLLDGMCILVGGAVLLTPGFITDLIGFGLLIPTTRAIAKGFLQKLFKKMIRGGSFVFISRR